MNNSTTAVTLLLISPYTSFLPTHIALLAVLQLSCNLLLDEHDVLLVETIYLKLRLKVVHVNQVIKHHHRCLFMLV